MPTSWGFQVKEARTKGSNSSMKAPDSRSAVFLTPCDGEGGAADALPPALAPRGFPSMCQVSPGQLPISLSEILSVERKHQKAGVLMRPRVILRLMFFDFEHHNSHLGLLLLLLLTEM